MLSRRSLHWISYAKFCKNVSHWRTNHYWYRDRNEDMWRTLVPLLCIILLNCSFVFCIVILVFGIRKSCKHKPLIVPKHSSALDCIIQSQIKDGRGSHSFPKLLDTKEITVNWHLITSTRKSYWSQHPIFTTELPIFICKGKVSWSFHFRFCSVGLQPYSNP